MLAETNVIDVMVGRLRRKIREAGGRRLIRTVRRRAETALEQEAGPAARHMHDLGFASSSGHLYTRHMADSPIKMEAHGVASVEGHTTFPTRDPRRGSRQPRPATMAPPAPGEATPGDSLQGDDPFRLGYRYRLRTTAEGREVVEQTPLCAEDLSYPQEGDVVSDGYPHNTGLQPRADSLRRHLEKRGATMVTSNVTLVLQSDGRNCSPDVAVIEGKIDRSKIKRAVNLRKLGGQLIFALEVVSTSEKEIEDKDVKVNLKRYAKEKVREYFSVYPIVESQVEDLVGRRLRKGSYVEIPPDAQGRVYSKELDLFFQIDAATKELVAIDARTGQRLLISDEEEAGRKKAEAALDAAEAALEQEAEVRRRAETALEQEAEVRRRAEAALEQEAEVRRRAEQGLRRNVEDLCGLLGIEWSSERSSAIADMGSAQLETLWGCLMDRKRWPDGL